MTLESTVKVTPVGLSNFISLSSGDFNESIGVLNYIQVLKVPESVLKLRKDLRNLPIQFTLKKA